MVNSSLSAASQMLKAMQVIQCDLSIVQKQLSQLVAQGADIFAISAALCLYIKRRVLSDMMSGSSDASLVHCAVICA